MVSYEVEEGYDVIARCRVLEMLDLAALRMCIWFSV